MTSKNSFFKLVLQNSMRRIWAVALALLGTMGTLLLPLFVIFQNYQVYCKRIQDGMAAITLQEVLLDTQNDVQSVLGMQNIFSKVVLFLLAVLCGFAMFRYLHDRRQVDFYHALPIKRGRLFAIHFVTGIVLVLPVFWIVYLVTILVATVMGFGALLTPQFIFTTLLGHSLFFIVQYGLAILSCTLTGNTIIAVCGYVVFQMILPVTMILIDLLQSIYFVTYRQASDWMVRLFVYGSPVGAYFGARDWDTKAVMWDAGEVSQSVLFGGSMLGYALVVAILIVGISYILFGKRKSEQSGMAMAFDWFQMPFKWVICLLGGLFIGAFFNAIFNDDGQMWMIIGWIIGVILLHSIIEIIYEFDFKAGLHHWKQMIAIGILGICIVIGFQKDILGYNTYVPALEQIASVGIEGFGSMQEQSWVMDKLTSENALMTTQDNIQRVHEIAEYAAQNYFEDESPEMNRRENITIYYKLKSGKTVARSYLIDAAPIWSDLLALEATKEYVQVYNPLFSVMPETIDTMTVSGLTGEYGVIRGTDAIEEVISQLQEEYLQNAKKHQNEVSVLRIGYDQVVQSDRTRYKHTIGVDVPIYPSDVKTLALIEKFANVKPVTLSADLIQKMSVVQYSEDLYEEANENTMNSSQTAEEWIYEKYAKQVTDPETINALLRNAIPSGNGNYDLGTNLEIEELQNRAENLYYSVTIIYKNDQYHLIYLKDKAPLSLIAQIAA